MLRDRSSRRHVAAFGLLVAASVGMLAVSGSGPVQELRRGVTFALTPVQEVLVTGTRSVMDVAGALGEIEDLRRENLQLSALVSELQDEVATLEALRQENGRLAEALRTQRALDHMTVAATVVNRQATDFERVITLDRGAESGVELGDAVVSEGGALAGSVVEVGTGWSSVRLLSDTRSLVIGLDATSRATGEVTGRLSSPLAMENIPVTDEVAAGDPIVTAGLDLGRRFRSAYPKNLLIGTVVDVQRDPGLVVQTALVEPAADLDRIETVLVIVDYTPPRRPTDGVDGGTLADEGDAITGEDGGDEAGGTDGP
jgi:rod shape-determining protein MreC